MGERIKCVQLNLGEKIKCSIKFGWRIKCKIKFGGEYKMFNEMSFYEQQKLFLYTA